MSMIKEQVIVLFFILFNGDIMLLFIKSFIVGIGKIIPGVSGALLAIQFNIYEPLINAITNFFSNWKQNSKFLTIFTLGLLVSIILCSKIVLYFITNYQFITMSFFIGLIIGGIYNFSREITYNYQSIIIIVLIVLLLLFITLNNFNNNYILQNNFNDNLIFFLGGIIEIFASIMPGISGTAILMIIGIYYHILTLITNIMDYQFLFTNINLYLSYGLGMFISFIVNSYLINYFLKKHRNKCYIVILGLSISSILYLIIYTLKIKFTPTEFIIGIMLLVIGLLLSSILDK